MKEGGELKTMEKLLIQMLFKTAENMTPEVREKVKELLDELERKAKATANPFDDFFVWLLRRLLGY